MDPTLEIKAKLPIEELVGQYCQLKKHGRGFVCVCPFHNDKHPSMQISPDKGIAYCFACNSGGDIFSFYQKIENVDFRQALKDLGERTGVKVEGLRIETPVQKDHKERIRECLQAALKFYSEQLTLSSSTKHYLLQRSVQSDQVAEFGLGFAPDSFNATYEYLLKAGFSRKEIVDASLGIQKDLSEGKIYDRFRNRLMFPIYDGGGDLVGFGGRTLGEDDAKYINSGETALYNKSLILYGLHLAKDAIRQTKTAVLVEGYFDVLACHKCGIKNAIAVSGTALTEQHVKLLKRYCEKVVLCLDQDPAGKKAAERSFLLCAEVGLPVYAVTLQEKDPDEAANKDAEAFAARMEEGGLPYLDLMIQELKEGDVSSAEGKRGALALLLPLLEALQSSVERGHYIGKVAALLSTTEVSLKEDIEQHKGFTPSPQATPEEVDTKKAAANGFSRSEISLGLFLLFPALRTEISQLIEPSEPFPAALYESIKNAQDIAPLAPDTLVIPEEFTEKASILLLYCEHHGFADWSESMARREIIKNCKEANTQLLRSKQLEIAKKLRIAQEEGNSAEESQLKTQYSQVLKLAQMASR